MALNVYSEQVATCCSLFHDVLSLCKFFNCGAGQQFLKLRATQLVIGLRGIQCRLGAIEKLV